MASPIRTTITTPVGSGVAPTPTFGNTPAPASVVVNVPIYLAQYGGSNSYVLPGIVLTSQTGDAIFKFYSNLDFVLVLAIVISSIILLIIQTSSILYRRFKVRRTINEMQKTQQQKYQDSLMTASGNTTTMSNVRSSMMMAGNTTTTSMGSQGQNNTTRFEITFRKDGNGGYAAPDPNSNNPDQPPADTLVEYEPVLSLPGFLQMEFSNDLRLKGKMAEGGGGVIYKADLFAPDFINRFGKGQVVVKVLKHRERVSLALPNMAFSELKSIVYQEIAIMHTLAHHPNIITLVGFTEEPLSIITKLYDRNLFSLVMALPTYSRSSVEYQALKNFIRQDTPLGRGLIVKGFEMLPEIAMHIAFGIASGMFEMHKYGILHRDLKSANVLMEFKPIDDAIKPLWMKDPRFSGLVTKVTGLFEQSSLSGALGWGKDPNGRPIIPINPIVCDFGLAKVIKKNNMEDTTPTAVKGMKEAQAVGISYRYAAPEAFNRMYNKGAFNTESKPVDVFAFAVMVWELFERKVPFHKITNKEVESKIKSGERPMISPKFKDLNKPPNGNRHYTLLVKIAEACWKHNPSERPTFAELKEKLRPFWLGAKQIADA